MTKHELKGFRNTLEARETERANAIRNRNAIAIEANSDELDQIQRASNWRTAFSAWTTARHFSLCRETSSCDDLGKECVAKPFRPDELLDKVTRALKYQSPVERSHSAAQPQRSRTKP